MALLQSLAWYSELLVDHAETFWSLFSVDLEAVLLMQPDDTWYSFPLFQILNDYLRTNGNFTATSFILAIKLYVDW